MLRLFKFLRPYWYYVLAGIAVLGGQAAAELYLPTLMSDMINDGMMQGNAGYVMRIGIIMLVVAVASAVCSIVASFFSARLALGFGRDVRNAVFEKVENYSLHEFERLGTATLITRTTNDIVQIQTVLVMAFRFIIYSPIMCVGGIIISQARDAHLSGVLVVAIPSLVIVMVIIASVVVPSFLQMQKKIDAVNLTMRESLTGVRVIRAFNKTEHERVRFGKANRELTDVSIFVNKVMAVMMPVMMLLFNATSVAIIWFGGVRISQGQMSIGDMMAFTQYAVQIMMSILMVAVMFVMIPRAQVSAKRVLEVLDMKAEVFDPEKPLSLTAETAHVEFKNVTFQYPGSEHPIFSDVSFSAGAGEITAIIGGTGSGKSTLIGLIPRFYDVSDGSVMIDGVDVRDMTMKDLRNKIGFVPQGATLFSGTIADNIRFGKEDATANEVEHAAKVAQAYDFVTGMSEGFESPIAQGGTNVSGGQKQRLAIARALVRRPEIYIFDDSFSALDFKTDSLLRAALKKEIENSTVLIVAQRITSIIDADRILVLDQGKIVAEGTHQQLLETSEVYREICASQLSEEELA